MIGRAVAARLARARVPLRLHGRSTQRVASVIGAASVSAALETVSLDLSEAAPAAYDALVAGCDAVVHCAALVHHRAARAEAYHRLNVRPTRNLVAAARAAGVRSFVLLSTLSVYGIGPFEDVEEDAPLRPVSAYAVSKAECEVALQAQKAITSRVVLRPGLVFGEGDRGNLLSMTRLIDRGLYFHIAGNAARKSVVCAADVARIVECCLRLHPEGDHVFNVANAAPVGVVELADLIAEQLGRRKSASLPRAIVRLGALVMDAMLGEPGNGPYTNDDHDMLDQKVGVAHWLSAIVRVVAGARRGDRLGSGRRPSTAGRLKPAPPGTTMRGCLPEP
jgi:UDP-glucose 4-epimerase